MPSSSRLSAPARKVFINQLSESTCSPVPSKEIKKQWTITFDPSLPTKTSLLDIVWLQGTVVSYDKDTDLAIIDDTTGTARVDVQDVRKLKKSADDLLTKGMYAIVIGTIIEIGQVPVIRALKCSELKNADIHQRLWHAEVDHQQNFISKDLEKKLRAEEIT